MKKKNINIENQKYFNISITTCETIVDINPSAVVTNKNLVTKPNVNNIFMIL